MIASQSQPSVNIDVGDEVVEAISRAAKDMPAGVIVVATGEIEDAEILALQRSKDGASRTHRTFAGPSDLVSLTGFMDGGRSELRAVIAREGDAGNVVVGGLLVRALSVSVRYRFILPVALPEQGARPVAATASAPTVTPTVIAQPEAAAIPPPAPPPPTPVVPPAPASPDMMTSAPSTATPALPPNPPAAPPPAAVQAQPVAPAPTPSAPEPPRVLVTPPPPPAPPAPLAVAAPLPRPAGLVGSDLSAALPPKILRKSADRDEFPEENDVVNHFHFGRCVVISSDGERLKLQQEKDSRVREVSLSMLKTDEPTILEDGRKFWQLSRKN